MELNTRTALRSRMLAILEETVDYYSADTTRRAVDRDSLACEYKTSDGRMCAFGRCMDPDKYTSSIEGKPVDIIPYKELLKPEYLGFPVDFWMAIQALHDADINWNQEGLSNHGKLEFQEIQIRIERGKYD